jgi:AraC-like DNA-binding protein/mannose-6-phosphate isomerase-like protein (cupin superfamily)
MKKKNAIQHFLSKYEIDKITGIETFIRRIERVTERHWHDFIEIELVTGGVGRQTVNGKEVELKRGALTVMRPIDHHGVEPIRDLRLINLSLDGRLPSEQLLARLIYGDTLFFQLSEEDTDGIEKLLLLLHEENEREKPSKAYVNNLVECLLIRILRLSKSADFDPRPSSRITEAISYLHLHFKEGVTLSALAEKLHYDPTHLSLLFRKETGVTFSSYVNTLRLSYARELLISTDLKVFEVGVRSGFSSLSNFLRAFKLEFGKTPQGFRQSGAAKNATPKLSCAPNKNNF